MKRLEDRNIIVTGSAQGMGLAIARALFSEGARVALCDVNADALRPAAESLDPGGDRVLSRKVDVRNKVEVIRFVQEVKDAWGGIDVLVNNAGGALHTPHRLEQIEEADWDLVVDVNLKGAFFFCQAVIPLMAEQGGGAIVNISALAAHYRASLAGVQYTAAKAGVEGLTRQLAYDWGKSKIRVNAVAPTVTLTGDRVRGLWEKKTESERQKVLSAIPLGRLSVPEEIASAVVFLASSESSYITGQCLDVSGGRYLR
jgi:NAD(P)-dependent dehydrogenase (short-subunit alcohol dehydrogenase family)